MRFSWYSEATNNTMLLRSSAMKRWPVCVTWFDEMKCESEKRLYIKIRETIVCLCGMVDVVLWVFYLKFWFSPLAGQNCWCRTKFPYCSASVLVLGGFYILNWMFFAFTNLFFCMSFCLFRLVDTVWFLGNKRLGIQAAPLLFVLWNQVCWVLLGTRLTTTRIQHLLMCNSDAANPT